MVSFPSLDGAELCSVDAATECGATAASFAAAAAASLLQGGAAASYAHPLLPPTHIPLDFTFVLYDSSSSLSLLLAYVTFAPIALLLVLLSSVVLRRDLEAAYQCAGLLLSTAINALLKRLFAQARPIGSAKLGHGMPSDHAQFSFFFVVYASAWLIHRCRMRRAHKSALIVLMASTALVVCYSRVHLGVHTLGQVATGSVVGAILGAAWALWARRRVWGHYFPRVESSTLGRFFSLKDGATVPERCGGTQQFEYEFYMAHKAAAAARRRGEQVPAAGGVKEPSGANMNGTRQVVPLLPQDVDKLN